MSKPKGMAVATRGRKKCQRCGSRVRPGQLQTENGTYGLIVCEKCRIANVVAESTCAACEVLTVCSKHRK